MQVPNVIEASQRIKEMLIVEHELQAGEEMLSSFVCDLEVIQLKSTKLNAQVEIKENDYHCVLSNFHKHDIQIQSVAKAVEIFLQQQFQMESHQIAYLKQLSHHLCPSFLNCPILHHVENVMK
jgi:hypothetical protein